MSMNQQSRNVKPMGGQCVARFSGRRMPPWHGHLARVEFHGLEARATLLPENLATHGGQWAGLARRLTVVIDVDFTCGGCLSIVEDGTIIRLKKRLLEFFALVAAFDSPSDRRNGPGFWQLVNVFWKTS